MKLTLLTFNGFLRIINFPFRFKSYSVLKRIMEFSPCTVVAVSPHALFWASF